jgi:hypothetical protein
MLEMEPIKVVARYSNGKIIKGFTQDFFPNKDSFHLFQANNGSCEAIEVFVRDLKAIFIVRDFKGSRLSEERKFYTKGEKPSGRKVEVAFVDGEVLVGSTLGYDPKRQGFFIFPADPKSNNERIFAVSSAVKQVRFQ